MEVDLRIIVFILICIILLGIIKISFSLIFKRNNKLHIKFIRSILNVVIIAICVYSCLSQFEVTKEISNTLLKSSALLIAIATFAAQHVLSNVISGISIIATKPFDIGDKVKIVSTGGSIISEGIVLDINLRHTTIKRFDGQCDIITNSIIDSSIISNTNLIENVGNFVEVEISYDSDVDLACDLLKSIIIENNLTLNSTNNTSVFVKEFTSNGLTLRVLVVARNLDDSFKACSDIRKRVLKDFKSKGIIIPYQTVTIDKR